MRRERGVALVEAAMVFPFVILLVLGVVDISRAYFDAAKVQEAAQEGALYASLNPGDPANAVARAEETISNPDFTGAISVSCPATDQVTVTVTYTFHLITPFIGSIFGSTFDLTHSETAQVLTLDPCTAWAPPPP